MAMRKIVLFMMVSLDGYFEGEDHDLSWHNAKNEEFKRLEAENAVTTDTILMGRVTYELMRNFWPSEMAASMDPVTAKFMNETRKYVVSHGPYEPGWQNAEAIHGDVMIEVRRLKAREGKDIAVFGSNILAVSLIEAGLMDEARIMVNPVALGAGTLIFMGLQRRIDLKRTGVRSYESGNVLLTYQIGE